jgi:peptide/nickel transport system substrate-binding protein
MRTRPSRRAARLGIAALVSFALVAAACGGGGDDDTTDGTGGDTESTEAGAPDDSAEPDSSTPVEGEITEVTDPPEEVPVAGGTLRYGLEADVDGLNPTTSSLSTPGLMMGNAVFDTLTRWDENDVAVPYLAESVTPVTEGDFTKWQVKLRPGITFHDGTPLNSAAIEANFQAQLTAPLVGLAVRPFYPDTGASEIIDDLTIQFNLLDANAFFPGALASQLGMVASPTWLAAAAADPTLNQAPVGTGPYVFDSRSADSVTRFVRNDAWWNGEVLLDAIEFLPVTDPATRNELLLAGDLDALQTDDDFSVEELTGDDRVQNVLDETGEEGFDMLNTAKPPFDDIRARQALALAFPRENYYQLITGAIPPQATQRFIPSSKYYNPDVVQVGDDLDAAAPLVAEYCGEFPENCSDGKINVEYQYATGAVINDRAAELRVEGVGSLFNVTLDPLQQDDLISQTATGDYNWVGWRQFGAEDPALDNVWLLCRTVGGISLNWPKYCDEERDALLLEAQATTDEARRIEIYKQVSQMMADSYAYIFNTHTIWDNAFAPNVRGVCAQESPEGAVLRCAGGGRTWFDGVWFAE